MNWRLWAGGILGLGLASLLAVTAAFGSASATVLGRMEVVYSDMALLSVIPGFGMANDGLMAYVDDNGLFRLDFRKGGLEGATFTMQPDSTYKFRDLFIVQNNGAARKSIAIDLVTSDPPQSPAPEMWEITGTVDGFTQYLLSGPAATPAPLEPGEALYVSVALRMAPGTTEGPRNYLLRIRGR